MTNVGFCPGRSGSYCSNWKTLVYYGLERPVFTRLEEQQGKNYDPTSAQDSHCPGCIWRHDLTISGLNYQHDNRMAD